MSTLIEQINSFHAFAIQQANNGGATLTIDEVYDRWRQEQELEETIADVRRGLEQLERGEGMSLNELRDKLHQRLGRDRELS